MTVSKEWHIALGMILCAAAGAFVNAYPGKSSSAVEGMTGSQDVRTLDRRISSLEQRLYSIEVNISRLQQSAVSQRPPVSQPSVGDQEIGLLRRELQGLLLRIGEIECGLVKLDERTTTPAVREARKSAGARTADPCRIDPAGPLRLSTRQ